MKLKDLLDPSKTYRVKPSKRLGEGAQGEVTLIDGFENNPSSYALKLYHCPPSTPQGQHLIHFVQYIRSQGQLKASPSLPLPLWAVEEEDEHRVGCIMRLISGRPLDSSLYHDLYTHPNGIRARLCAARSLAETVATLHRYQIVSADIADPNLHLDLNSLMVFHTDLDGGGILGSPLDNHFQLAPLVRGHFEGSSMAPELIQNERLFASIASDRWSLAVALHKLLFAGLDPYFALDTYQEAVENPTNWPVRQAPSVSHQKYIPFHAEEYLRLGPLLQQRFTSVFHHTVAQWEPELRPRAEDWLRNLEIALEWVQSCPYCKQEIIFEGLQTCPLCHQRWRAPVVWTKQVCVPLDRQGKSLLGIDLGFTDRNGRYVVAVFGRRSGRVCLFPQVPIFDQDRHKQYDPYQSVMIDQRSNVASFFARSGDGHQQAEFRIQNSLIAIR